MDFAISSSAGFVPQIGIQFRTYQINDTSPNITPYFDGFVNTGPWTYATTSAYAAGTKTIAIYYSDSQGNGYSSIGTQSGSSAKVMSVIQVPATLLNNESLQINLTFNCTLYPTNGTGNPITLTNGTATVLLEDLLY